MNIQEMINKIEGQGYSSQDARARVCQDVILKAIAQSSFSKNITIKGGVVMRSITDNVRRATQDMDIDFIRYSLSDESIDEFISKIDLGVHKHLEIEQEEYCFDIAYSDEGASLLINSREQMFTEKLRSLLKFGTFSTRYKDIYDMYYHCNILDMEKLMSCLEVYIFSDLGMRENNMSDVVRRVTRVFQNVSYKSLVDKSDKRWLDESIDEIFSRILLFLKMIE